MSSFDPPLPKPKMTPISSRFASVISRPLSAIACFAIATPITTLRAVRRTALKSIQSFGSKSDLARRLAVEVRRIPAGDLPEAGASVDEVVPDGVHVLADGADDPQAGDDDASGRIGLARWCGSPVGREGGGVRRGSGGRRGRRVPSWSSRARAVASGAIRRMRPVRTLPGPTSMKVSTPSARIRSTIATQSTPRVRCSTSSPRAPAEVAMGAASAFDRSGGCGSANATAASSRSIPVAASVMSGEWAATETGSSIARRHPAAFAARMAASTAVRSPERTTWPGEFRFATVRIPPAAPAATTSGSRASSRPMSAAIAPGRPAPEACMSSPRTRTSRTASARASDPAATRAEYWPIEWPAA